MNLDEVIRESLLLHCENTVGIDQYGQMHNSSLTIGSFIKDRDLAKQVYDFINEGNSKIVTLCTYGNRYQIYKAIYITDSKFASEVNAAFMRNSRRKEIVNSCW